MPDLRSDTVTKPSPEMLQAMLAAEVGDDVFEEDPTVKKLETAMAQRFGMEAGLFCASGTMANQVSIRVHTVPGDEIICDEFSHIYNYEGGGPAVLSGASIRVVHERNGIITPDDISRHIKKAADWHTRSRMVVVENSCNMTGGNYYRLHEIEALSQACRKHNLLFHIDGARIFNALVASGDEGAQYGKWVDSISVSLSKGLGCPVGAVLLGSAPFIKEARRIRKLFGGGMRQAGYLAAAGLYALDHHLPLLKEDHRRAADTGAILETLPFVENVLPVHTNIVIFKLTDDVNEEDFLRHLSAGGIKASAVRPRTIRFVYHLNVNDAMLDRVKQALKSFQHHG